MDFSKFIEVMHFTSLGWQVISALSFMLGDIITGFISAIIRDDVNSKKMWNGLLRKMLLIIIIALSFIVQYAFFNMEIISKLVCIYIIAMELISILENIKLAGIDLGKLSDILKNEVEKNDK